MAARPNRCGHSRFDEGWPWKSLDLFRIASLTSCIGESRNCRTLQAVLLRASTGLYEEVCPMGSEGRDDSFVDSAAALTLRQQISQ